MSNSQTELAAMRRAYEGVCQFDDQGLATVVSELSRGPVAFIASGGMLAVASFAALLHERVARQPAEAITPLQAIERPPLRDSGAVLFTSSGRHPDAREVMRRLGRPGLRPAAIVTHSRLEPESDGARVVALPSLPGKEGFLAVASVISMTTALVRSYLSELRLPARMPAPLRGAAVPADVDRLIVLHGPEDEPVAVDLETRLSELGLAAVQTSDYRNFAHGRHFGFYRRLERTSILAVTNPRSSDLAEATISALPREASIMRWDSGLDWPLSTLQLIATSASQAAALAEANGVNPRRPGVPPFGRKLYHLPLRRRFTDRSSGPIERKIGALGGTPRRRVVERYQRAHDRWIAELGERTFGGVVIDYDGTICATAERYDPPSPAMAEQLNRLLSRGIRLGVASGRGRSLHRDLRQVIDPQLWARVELGIYNGSVRCRLDEELGRLDQPSPLIESALERIEALAISPALQLDARCSQLSVGPKDGARIDPQTLDDAVWEAVLGPPSLPLKIVASGHSLDVVPAGASKVQVIERIRHLDGPVDVLAIGDQGQVGGNDFELLSYEPWSLSVDRCSSDPSRCWNLGSGETDGPLLLLDYLRALRRAKGGVKIRPIALP